MSNETPSSRKRLFLLLAATALVALLALPAAFAGSRGGFGGRACHRGEMTAEQVQRRAEFFAAAALDEADATDEQRDQVAALLQGVGERVLAARAEHDAAREAWRAAFLAETIDEARLESLRQDLLQEVDDGSTELLGLATDLAAVLTPEQRQALADAAERWHR
jgi:Spy/CpxP family protein refolding chaperone